MSSNTAASFNKYLAEIDSAIRRGNSTEHTHRPSLKTLLQELNSAIHAVNEPKREKCGAPDYAILTKQTENPFTIGHVEAKDVGISLDEVELSEQLVRYRKNLTNLILTNYLEFRWYVDGKLRMNAKLGFKSKNERIKLDERGSILVEEMIENFLSRTPNLIKTPEDLANRMARNTRMIKDIIIETYNLEEESKLLSDVRDAFSSILIPEYKEPEKLSEFANMYAQTLAYGLFAARCNHEKDKTFTRQEAAAEIPMSNPFLRMFFEVVTGVELEDEPYVGFVNDLVQLYSQVDIDIILRNFGEQGKKKDPIFHFYETFSEKYDPGEKTRRGVYYTPLPVVSYIVKSVESILKSNFDISEGLADSTEIEYNPSELSLGMKDTGTTIPKVLILDPACGTGTFLYEVVEQIRNSFMKQHNAGLWNGFVRNQLLPRLFGFEIMMAPHSIAHLKIGLQLSAKDLKKQNRKDWEFNFSKRDRIGIYLTNTLDEANKEVKRLYGAFRAISEEAEEYQNI